MLNQIQSELTLAPLDVQRQPLLTVGDVQRVLHPLRETADRVGKQVERFAENLDRLSRKTHSRPIQDFEGVLPLVEAYKGVAARTVQRLRKIHSPEKQKDWKKRLRSSTTRASTVSDDSENDEHLASESTVGDLKRWESEEQTWTLLSLMLQLQYPASRSHTQSVASSTRIHRPTKERDASDHADINDCPAIHQFSSEQELWNSYIANHDIAWERHVITQWLQQCADETSPDVEAVVRDLERDADRGDGLWAHGWLYSKEAIKAQKRLRSGAVSGSITTSDHSQPLITQLDPDAVSRQGRSLEKQDNFFEQAIWRACWEMVRRGKDWNFIRSWCKERVEGWRAVTMLGDPRTSPGTSNLQSRGLWRQACCVASLHSEVDKYENAVYGALSGHVNSVLKVCQTWEDYLFSHFNCLLIRGFDDYVGGMLPKRAKPSLLKDFGVSDPISISLTGRDIVEKLQKYAPSREQAADPIRLLQGSLVAKNFEEFIFLHGSRLLTSVQGTENAKSFPPKMSETSDTGVVRFSMQDYDNLRILTHMLFLFEDLGLNFVDFRRRSAAESIVVAYIDFLSKAGKLELIPLYASRLDHPTAVHCLARQLPRIRDDRDRRTVLALSNQGGIDMDQVLAKQLQLIIEDGLVGFQEAAAFPKLSIFSQGMKSRTQWREMKPDFLDTPVDDAQIDLIQGFQWYVLDGTWTAAMRAGVMIYKFFLGKVAPFTMCPHLTCSGIGALTAASELCKSVTFSELSLSKTQNVFGRSIDLAEMPNDDSNVAPAEAAQQKRMIEQSKHFRDFEALFIYLDALQQWSQVVPPMFVDHGISSTVPRLTFHSAEQELMLDHETVRGLKNASQRAYTVIKPAMDYILDDWLTRPENGEYLRGISSIGRLMFHIDWEASEFTRIRHAYLPEVIISYLSFLNRCSKYLTRSHLLDCMDVAPRIAGSPDLTECFVGTGRMGELVDALALSSVTLVRAEETGVKSQKKKSRDGRSLALWSVAVAKE